MFKCELCKREFETATKLVSHLTHPKSSCKINIKDYYDKFLRKPNEGICIYCGRETSFGSIVKGYLFNKCKHCRNEGESTKLERKKTYKKKKETKKRNEDYYKLPEFCELCKLKNENIRFKAIRGLSKHISQKHNESIQEYYDKFLKKPGEGICLTTGKSTKFKSMVEGYFKYSGKGNNSKDPNIQKKKEETLMNNFGVSNPIHVNKDQRLENFKLHFKNQQQLKEQKNNLLCILRKLTIDKNNKNQCQICGLKFDTIIGLANHIIIHNKITSKEYYDNFFKIEGEGICPSSKKETSFVSIEQGYLTYKENYQSNPNVVQKIKNSLLERTKNKILSKCDSYNIKILDINEIENITSLIHIQCIKCNHVYINRMYNIQLGFGKCPKCYPRNTHISTIETEVYDFINESFSGEVIQSCKNIIKNYITGYPLELDVFVPSKNIAFEFNGLYWHSEQILKNPMTYHLNKYNLCKEKGIQLIQIFEDEWLLKRQIIESMIRFRLQSIGQRIYARNCSIKEIDPKTKNLFLDENHIQGQDKSLIKLGLFDSNNILVSVMTFSHGNISKGGDPTKKLYWELNRYASKQNCHVIGGAGKLLKYFQLNYNWEKIYSYADLRFSSGNLYNTLGFNLVHQTQPEYWYVDDRRRIHRYNLRKRPDEPKNIPEWQLRLDEGYYRIWDCGHLKFELKNLNIK